MCILPERGAPRGSRRTRAAAVARRGRPGSRRRRQGLAPRIVGPGPRPLPPAPARVGLIGVGADNTYGHPTSRALDMLTAAGTTPFRTDLQGTIVVRRGSAGPEVWTERDDAPSSVQSAAAVSSSVRPPSSARAVSGSARRLVAAPSEGPHARQEARSSRREDRPGPVVGIRPAPVVLVTGPETFLAERSPACCATCSSARTPRSRSTTSKPTSTHRACWRPWPVPPCSASPGWCGSPTSRSAPTRSSPRPSRTSGAPADDVTLVLRHGGGVRGKKLLDTIRSGVGGGIEVQCDELKRETGPHRLR